MTDTEIEQLAAAILQVDVPPTSHLADMLACDGTTRARGIAALVDMARKHLPAGHPLRGDA